MHCDAATTVLLLLLLQLLLTTITTTTATTSAVVAAKIKNVYARVPNIALLPQLNHAFDTAF